MYALGVVMFELLAGQLPLRGASLGEFKRAHLEETFPNVCSLVPTVPQEMAAIIERCLDKNPVRRFRDYQELATELTNIYTLLTGQSYDLGHEEENMAAFASDVYLLHLGDSLAAIGRSAEAMRYYERLLEANPKTARGWQRKGEMLLCLQKPYEAALYFSKALEIEPSSLETLKGYVQSLMITGNREAALTICNPALAHNPNEKELLRFKRLLRDDSISLSMAHQQDRDNTIHSFVVRDQAVTVSESGQNVSEQSPLLPMVSWSDLNTSF